MGNVRSAPCVDPAICHITFHICHLKFFLLQEMQKGKWVTGNVKWQMEKAPQVRSGHLPFHISHGPFAILFLNGLK